MEQDLPDSLRAAAEEIFGSRIELALAYARSLSTAGVERGLIGPREVPRLWERHILNCAVLGELVDRDATVVDIGSGAGLPGIPLAIARPDLKVTLVEPLLRRTKYLVEIVDQLGLDVAIVRGRAEQPGVLKEAGEADFVTSRAVAPLEKLVQWSLPFIHTGGQFIAIKGSSAEDEIVRSAEALRRLGAGSVEVVQCGVDLLPTPTTVVRATREPKRPVRQR